MSIRHGLLALLSQRPTYGAQLRADFEARTGGSWPLNVGQVYTTLNRLERDGLVEQLAADDEGHKRYAITVAGQAEVDAWLASPTVRTDRDELAIKLAVARTLPGADVAAIIAAQRLERPAQPGVIGAWLEAMAEAERRWLDVVAALPGSPQPLDGDAPRRGRPARTQT